jgi:hypothetical protein
VDIPRDMDAMLANLLIAIPMIVKRESMGDGWKIDGLTSLETDALFFNFAASVSQGMRPPLGMAGSLVRAKIVTSKIYKASFGYARFFTPTAKYVEIRRLARDKLSGAVDTDRMLEYVDANSKMMVLEAEGKSSTPEYGDLMGQAEALWDSLLPEHVYACRAAHIDVKRKRVRA